MTVTFVAVEAITNSNATIPFPAGATGDLLLLAWESDTHTDVAAASGWVGASGAYTNLGSGDATHAIGYLWKIAASASSGSQVFTGLTTTGFCTAQIYRYSGTDSTSPINVGGTEADSNVAASITTTVANCMEFAAISYDAGATTAAAPSGWTRRQDGSGQNWYGAERLLVSAGPSGTTTFQTTVAGVGMVHIALAPPASGFDVPLLRPVPQYNVHRM